MLRRPYSLPSLSSLVAFEAAARHLSLTRAASELNVTAGAISKHIKGLEQELGQPLFRRLHRSLALTPAGESLASTLSESFTSVSTTFKQLKAAGEVAGVSLGTTTAFAQLWLMPRLGAFWSAHQDITIDHVISDRAQELFRPDVDLRVRYGDGEWPGESSARMFGDSITAVASPGFLKAHKVKSLRELVEVPLLSVEGMDASWTSWQGFLAELGVPARKLKLRRFNSYVVALQAARSGQGLALGWNRLVDPLIKAGDLKAVPGARIVSPGSYYVTWAARKPLGPQAEFLKAWLLNSVS